MDDNGGTGAGGPDVEWALGLKYAVGRVMLGNVIARSRRLFSLLWLEIMKFGAVGGIAYVIDSTIFIFLREGVLSHRTLVAGIIASVVATAFSWLANRYWTFRHRRRSALWRELTMFCLMNAIGIGIATFCLFISHYVLGFQTTHADFIAKNVIGLVLGTIFRFLAYRYWVFTEELADDPDFALDRRTTDDANTAAFDEPATGTDAGDTDVSSDPHRTGA